MPDQNDTSLPDTQALPAHNFHNSITADISLATIYSTSSSTLDTSLATVSPDTSLTTVSSTFTSTLNTSFMASVPSRLQSAYNFFQFAPPDLQDDDVDLDFNSTILPMPPNYKPPSPLPPSSPIQFSSTSSGMDWFASSRLSPLTSTSRLADLNSAGPLGHDSDNALTTLQSQASPPCLCHISSILTKTANANNPFAPMTTPTLMHSPTSVEIPSVQPSSVVSEPPIMKPIMATPSLPATVGRVLPATTKAVKHKSTKSNEIVSAKHQKREGAVVLPTENSQPIEGDQVDFTFFYLAIVYIMDKVPTRVDGRFRLGDVLGSGSYAVVYRARNIIKDNAVAIKLEPINHSSSMQREYRILKILEGGIGIPRALWFGRELAYHALVLDLLGPSLHHIFLAHN
ncbi:hypothetical protein CY34DRAFT_17243 [Suillus luteus UH-Slu-Lm8-n1]|uniref:Protein kinase domain-containing protein n=1 Tax=Suillus luteus UH-Slu-Lm8-n1 TaxID=930992 RepID=A0A0D0A010_9AGAM|nr:hypothetical protein CY34DRAFT_17243 [Suillus luteus UH-Slu-Lm8-n1]